MLCRPLPSDCELLRDGALALAPKSHGYLGLSVGSPPHCPGVISCPQSREAGRLQFGNTLAFLMLAKTEWLG